MTQAQTAVEEGTSGTLLPVSPRRQLMDLSDDIANRIDIQYYTDATDTLLEAIEEQEECVFRSPHPADRIARPAGGGSLRNLCGLPDSVIRN